ncbi:MAG: hypothetical protein VX130_04900 [Verrucomicrobiota bacterium]|nr:hypothetical protein [Verrucomicrobiota bacterium]
MRKYTVQPNITLLPIASSQTLNPIIHLFIQVLLLEYPVNELMNDRSSEDEN